MEINFILNLDATSKRKENIIWKYFSASHDPIKGTGSIFSKERKQNSWNESFHLLQTETKDRWGEF